MAENQNDTKFVDSITLRNGTRAALLNSDEVFQKGELILETDTYRIKMGDGAYTYADLPYVSEDWIKNYLGANYMLTSTIQRSYMLQYLRNLLQINVNGEEKLTFNPYGNGYRYTLDIDTVDKIVDGGTEIGVDTLLGESYELVTEPLVWTAEQLNKGTNYYSKSFTFTKDIQENDQIVIVELLDKRETGWTYLLLQGYNRQYILNGSYYTTGDVYETTLGNYHKSPLKTCIETIPTGGNNLYYTILRGDTEINYQYPVACYVYRLKNN